MSDSDSDKDLAVPPNYMRLITEPKEIRDYMTNDDNVVQRFSPFLPFQEDKTSIVPLDALLEDLRRSAFETSDNYKIIVRRRHIFHDALIAFKANRDWKRPLSITFLGEPAVDIGGPCREFLRLLIEDVCKSSFFEGTDESRVPVHNVVALEQQTYKYIGQMIAVSIVNGGPGPHCFSKAVANYICYGVSNMRATIPDVPDGIIQEKLRQLENADNDEQFQDLLQFFDRFEIGLMGPVAKSGNGSQTVQRIAYHYAIARVKSELDDLKEGLKTLNVLELFHNFPDTTRPLLVTSLKKLSVGDFQELFCVNFSQPGTNRREKEEEIVIFWYQLLLEIEDSGGCLSVGNLSVSLGDVLAFITGASTVPTFGFDDQPTISFLTDKELLPHASTCANTISLPVVHASYNEFRNKMLLAFAGTVGFGQV